jgi:hypothetical protein
VGSIYLRKYGVATTIDFCLYELDGTDLKVDAAYAAGDIAMMKDEGNQAAPAAGFTDEGTGYSLALSLAEMQAARIVIYIVDQTNPKAWLDKCLIIETYGNASAQHPFDLATATQNVNVASSDNIDFGATMKASINTEVDNALNTEVPAVNTLNSVNDLLRDQIDITVDNMNSNVINMAVNVTDILVDTDELQTDWHDGGRLDLIVDATKGYVDTEVADIKAVTDTLTLAAIADAVHDETTEVGMTLREAINIILAALAGKSSGGGTNTIKFQDQADTKPRITATVTAVGDRTAITNDGA